MNKKEDKRKPEKYIEKLGEDIVLTPKNKLFCKLCGKIVNSSKKYNVEEHIKTKKKK